MTNEYLFSSNEHRTSIENYNPDGVATKILDIENSPLWIISFSLENRNEESAGRLSEIHSVIMDYSPLILTCESSEYYNKSLYPLINELERKLRKLLYIAASMSSDNGAKENIQHLEEKDFGEIFDLLFIDPRFIYDIKKRVNADAKSEFNGKSKFCKREIEVYLSSLEEHILWDAILSANDVPTLRRRFREVQSFRNDVMHAHNIDKESYGKAHYLFGKINRELNYSIAKLTGATENHSAELTTNVNTSLSMALSAMQATNFSNLISALETLSLLHEFKTNFQFPYSSNQIATILKSLSTFQSTLSSRENIPKLQGALVESLKHISPLLAYSSNPSTNLNDSTIEKKSGNCETTKIDFTDDAAAKL